MKSGIYVITNTVNGHRYIGKTNDLKRRKWEHFNPNSESNKSLSLAYKKYGIAKFKYEILEFCPVEMLNEREIYYISALKPEYNRTNGGDGSCGHNVSETTRKVLSEKGKLQWAMKSDKEKKKFIRNNLKGPKIGHAVSQETREKLRAANLGSHPTLESEEKRINSLYKNGGNERIRKAHSKPVICHETGIVYSSIKDAELSMNISNIGNVCSGKYKQTKGFHFSYCSVETTRDECSGVGPKMSCGSKCMAHSEV